MFSSFVYAQSSQHVLAVLLYVVLIAVLTESVTRVTVTSTADVNLAYIDAEHPTPTDIPASASSLVRTKTAGIVTAEVEPSGSTGIPSHDLVAGEVDASGQDDMSEQKLVMRTKHAPLQAPTDLHGENFRFKDSESATDERTGDVESQDHLNHQKLVQS